MKSGLIKKSVITRGPLNRRSVITRLHCTYIIVHWIVRTLRNAIRCRQMELKFQFFSVTESPDPPLGLAPSASELLRAHWFLAHANFALSKPLVSWWISVTGFILWYVVDFVLLSDQRLDYGKAEQFPVWCEWGDHLFLNARVKGNHSEMTNNLVKLPLKVNVASFQNLWHIVLVGALCSSRLYLVSYWYINMITIYHFSVPSPLAGPPN